MHYASVSVCLYDDDSLTWLVYDDDDHTGLNASNSLERKPLTFASLRPRD